MMLWLILKYDKKLSMLILLSTIHQCQLESIMVRDRVSVRGSPFIWENIHIYFIQQLCLDKTCDETIFLHVFR